tara:strand:- start:332 stop:2302 length:1971 start_codon:yes stop_codon:yes gene_type:complete
VPRVPTTADVANPQRKGYGFRLDNLLFRTAVSTDRPLTIRTAEFPSQQIDLRTNPEDITTNIGQIFSRNDFSGGQGLDYAHKRTNSDKDTTRFYDSKGVDVFNADTEISYQISLLHTMTDKGITFSGTKNYMTQTTNGYLYVTDATTIYKSTDNGENWAAMTSTNVSYAIHGIAAFGNNLFVITGDSGTNKQLISYNLTTDTWTDESLGSVFTGYFTGIWFVKGRLLVTGKSTEAEYLWETAAFAHNFSGDFQTADAIITTEPTHEFTAMADAGAVILACSTDGNIYSLKDVSGTLQVLGQSRIGDEEVHSINALEGIIFYGTQEYGTNIGRLYKSNLVVADNLYVLGDRQLIKEWDDSVLTAPHAMFATRDSIFLGVQENSSDVYLWRYYLPTASLARDRKLTGQGIVSGIRQTAGKFIVIVEGANGGITKETTSYEDSGYIVTPNIDFFTSEVKQWVGTTIEHDEIVDTRRIQCFISTRPETINDANATGWELANDSTQGFGGDEVQINRNARYLNMKVVLQATDDNTGTPVFRSVSARALPRPQLVVVDIPVNISDQVERPNRKRLRVRNLGEAVYQELKQKEGDSVTLQLFDPDETIRGVVESVAYPVINDANIGSVTQYCTVRIRGVRAEDVISQFTNTAGIGTLGVVRLG